MTVLAPEMPCAFCRRAVPMPPALLDELRGYEARVGSAVHDASEEAEKAAAWQPYASHRGSSSRSMLLAFGLFFGLPLLVSAAWGALFMTGAIPPSLAPVGSFLALGSALAGVVIYTLKMRSGSAARRARAVLAPRMVACPSCGAPNALGAGQSTETCGHCRAPLFPSRTMVRNVVSDADAALRRARMDRYRAERAGAAYVSSFSAAGSVVYFVLGPFAFMTACGAVGATIEVFEKGMTLAFPVTWGAFLILGGTLVGIVALRRDRRRRLDDALHSVAHVFGAKPMDARAAIQWLNTFWAGPIDPVAMYTGRQFGATAALVYGFPVLAWVDPTPMTDGFSPRVEVFVAAWLGAPSWMRPGRLEQLGFVVRLDEGGVRATANQDLVKRIQRHPEMARVLAVAMSAAADIAASLGAHAVSPIP